MIVLTFALAGLLIAPAVETAESYFHLRQIESISSTGLPFWHDTLAWGGRELTFSPVFHYLVAGAHLLLGGWALKAIPAALLAACSLLTYLISRRLTNSEWAGMAAAIASLPILAQANTLSPITLALPLMLASTLFLLDIETKTVPFLICLGLLAFTHPTSLVWFFGLAIYLALSIAEEIPLPKAELEVGLFSLLFVLWAHLVLYKKLFVEHGLSVVWQNMPPQFIAQYFSEITLFDAVIAVGVLPSIAAAYIFWKYLFRHKNKELYMIMGVVAAATLVIWWRIIPLSMGLVTAGIFMIPLFAHALHQLYGYVLKTRAANYATMSIVAVMLVLALTSAIPLSMMQTEFHESDMQVLRWIQQMTPENAIVAAPPRYGHLVTAIAKRPTVLDTNFLLQEDAIQRYNDIERLMKTPFQIEAVSIMDRYNAEYIFVPEGHLAYETEGCFRRESSSGSAYVLYKRSSCRARTR